MWLPMWRGVRQVKGDSHEAHIGIQDKKLADGYGDFNAPDAVILHQPAAESQVVGGVN